MCKLKIPNCDVRLSKTWTVKHPIHVGLSVNITAGRSVLIKQVSVHKQLINKSCPSPLSSVFACLSHFTTSPYYTLHPWIAASVYYAHGGHSERHNDTIVTLPHMPRSHLPCDPRGQLTYFWHWVGTWKRHAGFFLSNSSPPVSLQDVMSSQALMAIKERYLMWFICLSLFQQTMFLKQITCYPVCLSAGSFHLIHLMFDDYVLYLLESLHCQERANDLMRAMKGEGSTGETATCSSRCLFWD